MLRTLTLLVILGGLLLSACAAPTSQVPTTAAVTTTEAPTMTPAPAAPTSAPTAAPTAAASGTFGAAWERVDCATFGFTAANARGLLDVLDCGYVTTPQFHRQPDGPTIKLAVLRARSTGTNPAPDPLFMENGGPGSPTIGVFGLIALPNLPEIQDILASRDMIFVDQRGSGNSQPSLMCTERLDHDIAVAKGEIANDDTAAFEACRDRLAAAGVNFNAFNSVENAADMYLVAETLGYESFNFYGASYGSLLAQYVMDQSADHTAQLRSVIVDAVAISDSDWNAASSSSASNALRNLFAECAQDEQCKSTYPDIEATFLGLIDKLNQEPVATTLTVTNAAGEQQTIQSTLDGNDLILATFVSFYNNKAAASLPLRINQSAKTGDLAWVAEAVTPAVSPDAEAMYAAVICARLDSAQFDATTLLDPPYPQLASFGPDEVVRIGRQCDVLSVEAEEPFVQDHPDTPTLLLNGTRDQVMPLAYGKRVAESLTTAYPITVPGSAHGSLLQNACSNQIVLAFLAEPGQAPDTSCMAARKPPFEYP